MTSKLIRKDSSLLRDACFIGGRKHTAPANLEAYPAASLNIRLITWIGTRASGVASVAAPFRSRSSRRAAWRVPALSTRVFGRFRKCRHDLDSVASMPSIRTFDGHSAVQISASSAARDRNRSTTVQPMSLKRSLIEQQHRPILGQPPAR